MTRIESARIILFGVGGVGSWCAEGLIRNGIRHLTIVDCDNVCESNINRQLEATSLTVGQVKVEVMKARLLEINPEAEIVAINKQYTHENSAEFALDDYDYIIDAIDSLKDKRLLIEMACQTKAVFFSSMGAALKMDPTRIKVAEFWKVEGCPLARALRQRFKRLKRKPARKFLCVYSDELLENKGHNASCGTDKCMCPKAMNGPGDAAMLKHEWCSSKAQINGSLMHITAIFGMTIAGLVVTDAVGKEK